MTKSHIRYFPLTCMAGLVLLAGCGHKGATEAESPKDIDLEHPVREADNNDFISVSGTVVEARDDEFELDYGSGRITVEMDDYDDYPEGRHLFENDRVVVYGYVDDEFYERRTIEAQSVYVRNLGTQFYASGVDDEDFPVTFYHEYYPGVAYRGKIVKVDGGGFTLDTGIRQIQVNTSALPYDPLDKEGFQRLESGDRVFVTGTLDGDLFDLYELDAGSVTELTPQG